MIISTSIRTSKGLIKRLSCTSYLVQRKMSSIEEDVLFETVGDKGVITLNRPKALNAVNLSMIQKLLPKLIEWEKTKSMVLIKGAGGKAFCSGGDVKALVQAGMKGENLGSTFFRHEYTMNAVIGYYKIPYVALIDGVVMGGGVGLSVHGKYRVATEKTLFAMPETAIGLFPDVGGSYFLPRLKGKLGTYLALTGDRLKGSDVLKAGIATHYCDSSKLNDLESALLKIPNANAIDSTLKKFCTEESQLPEFSLNAVIPKIDRYFRVSSVEESIKMLEEDGSDWARKTVKILREVSPTSIKVTFKELQLGENMNLKECLQMEYRLAYACLIYNDFFEGVRALLIDKDKNPKWKPTTLEDVTDDIVQKHFQKLPDDQELKHKL